MSLRNYGLLNLNILNSDNEYYEFCKIFFSKFSLFQEKKKKKKKNDVFEFFYERARYDRGF